MERGLYAAASGMIAQQAIQDTLAQNIANANTVGYKQDNPTFRAVHAMKLERVLNGTGRGAQIGDLGMGVAPDQVYTDWQAGTVVQTGNPLDASLEGNQFFAVGTPAGERYTRAGDFKLDSRGNLLTGGGLPVLDINNRPINTGGGNNLALDNWGNLDANGQPVARLKIVQIDPSLLRKQGDSLFAVSTPNSVQLAPRPQIHPGTLEQSNVNAVRSLVQMITVTRGFDMAQKAILTQDDLLKHATTELGKL